ncbi:MAG TPA: hypothetical protein VK586_18795 [Streptosporangiaceae bacterium]|nr:hypothetical protein [Streptosporangiaceae bacterium]
MATPLSALRRELGRIPFPSAAWTTRHEPSRRLGGRSEHGVRLDPRSLLPACAAFPGALE